MLLQRLGHTFLFRALGLRLTSVNRWLLRKTQGRWSLAGRSGLPLLLLTTTGRRSGLPRTRTLLYVQDARSYVVAGVNWGLPQHPDWCLNLISEPMVTVTIDGSLFTARAQLVGGPEWERLWSLLLRVWPAFAVDRHRAVAARREIPVFRLERGHRA